MIFKFIVFMFLIVVVLFLSVNVFVKDVIKEEKNFE